VPRPATDLQHVVAVIQSYQPSTLAVASWRQAAVLVPLRRMGASSELEVIFTRRAETLATHSGQVSFPGGSVDPFDASPEAAALREAQEEMALDPAKVHLLGSLDHILSHTGFHIVPVVGLVDERATMTPAAEEVARVFAVPLAELADRPRWQVKTHERGGRTYELPHFYADGEDIWGLTAFMLLRLVELL
jgi:8-oxo-dGTP pyrophosphatase MutT (NUDIX family)